jgi:hypothetical protein
MIPSTRILSVIENVPPGVEYHPPQETRQGRGGDGAPPCFRVIDGGNAGEAKRRRPPALEAMGPVVVGNRVDWLSAAFRVALDVELLEHVATEAREWGRVAVTLGGLEFEAKKMRTGKRLLFRNADVGIVVDPEGPEGWTVQVDCPGEYMSRTTLGRAVEVSRHLAAAFGVVVGERARRLDLCADVAGFDIRDADADGWVKPSRARIERASAEDVAKAWEHPEMREYTRGGRLTGYTICPGNALACVVYDKIEELTQLRPDKLAAESERWKLRGWDGKASVTRVEFRLRSEVLHQLGCRDGLDRLQEKLDAVWGYCSRMWIRLVLPWTSSRVARCEIHPAWEVIRRVRFAHEATPALRVRLRQGVTSGHALGAVFSLVGGEKRLPHAERWDGEFGEVLEGKDVALSMKRSAAETAVKRRVMSLFGRAARIVSRELVDALGPRRALAVVLERENATRARFSGIGAALLRPARAWGMRQRQAA